MLSRIASKLLLLRRSTRRDGAVPAHIQRLTRYRPGLSSELLASTETVKLASNENSFGPSPKALAAVSRGLDDLFRYPDSQAAELRRAVALHHHVQEEEIVFGNGSNEIIDLVCRALTEPGDVAVIGCPSFVYYPIALGSANLRVREAQLRDCVHWDLPHLKRALGADVRLIFVDTPNNPTGSTLTRSELRELLQATPRHTFVIIDEAYAEYADEGASAIPLRDLHPRLIVLRTFSKAYGLAGLRVGYAIADATWVDYLERVRPPFNVNTLAQRAALEALRDQKHLQEVVKVVREERERMARELEQMGLEVAPSGGNFLLTCFGSRAKVVFEKLLQRGLVLRPSSAPVQEWLRITVGTAQENNYALTTIRGTL